MNNNKELSKYVDFQAFLPKSTTGDPWDGSFRVWLVKMDIPDMTGM